MQILTSILRGRSDNGSIIVSKTKGQGSIPCALVLKRIDEWFKSTQAGQLNKGKSNGSFLSTRSAIGAHSLEIVTHL